jgi:hypothetical protein
LLVTAAGSNGLSIAGTVGFIVRLVGIEGCELRAFARNWFTWPGEYLLINVRRTKSEPGAVATGFTLRNTQRVTWKEISN